MKLDGYSAQAIHGTRLRLLSRRGKDFGSQFTETYRALASAIPVESIVDGELVALDAQGGPDFQALQNSKTSGALVVFFVFDLLTFAGRDVRMLPLIERQKLLRLWRVTFRPRGDSVPLPRVMHFGDAEKLRELFRRFGSRQLAEENWRGSESGVEGRDAETASRLSVRLYPNSRRQEQECAPSCSADRPLFRHAAKSAQEQGRSRGCLTI